jgi:hypothetical protein
MNFLLVKEGHELTLREGSEVGLDALNKLRDAALLVVAARVADEEVAGHGFPLFGCASLCREATRCRARWGWPIRGKSSLAVPARYCYLATMTLTLDQAQQNLREAAQQALLGEPVLITLAQETLRLTPEVPLRLAGYFAACYRHPEDATFEDRICGDSAVEADP